MFLDNFCCTFCDSLYNDMEMDLRQRSGTPTAAELGYDHEKGITKDKNHDNSRSLKGDRQNIALLMFLYLLQGIPLGIAASIPYLLQSRKVNYSNQAIFSFVHWPFSLKLLWAPVVDSIYVTAFGKRKTWLVPTQYLISVFMFVLSRSIGGMMDDTTDAEGNSTVNVVFLTLVFFMLNFLAATQDIAVDGWALTMLSKKNVGWVSTCNTVGQTTGYMLGNVLFLALESPDFSNKYLRSEPQTRGVLTLSGFLYFWSIVFFISTTLVALLKHETSDRTADSPAKTTVVAAYKQLWRVIQLPSVLSLIGILLTIKIGFVATDAVTGLKLIEEGVPKEQLAMMAIPLIPVDIILPIVITHRMSTRKPLDMLLKAMPFRLLLGLVFAVFVWWAPSTKTAAGEYPIYFYGVMLFFSALHQVTLYCMFVPMMAFFARISDPVIGGTYMTLLNTVSNLGGNWPSTVALWLIDYLTFTGCIGNDGSCIRKSEECLAPTKTCTLLDGYYVESVLCVIIGFAWMKLRVRKLHELQELPAEEWTYKE